MMVALTPEEELSEEASQRIGYRLQEAPDIFEPFEYYGVGED
jgi:hypothetical protein